MLERLRNPCKGSGRCNCCGSRNRSSCRRLGCTFAVVFKCCRRRVKITRLERTRTSAEHKANAVQQDWCYFVGQIRQSEQNKLHLELFLDSACYHYPAVVEGPNATLA